MSKPNIHSDGDPNFWWIVADEAYLKVSAYLVANDFVIFAIEGFYAPTNCENHLLRPWKDC